MPRHPLTPEESAKGGRNRGKLMLKLQKEAKKRLGMELNNEIILALITNPAVIGTGLYLIVHFINGKLKAGGNPSPTVSQTPLPTFLSDITSFLAKIGVQGVSSTSSVAEGAGLGDFTLDLLEAALLAYITTGGNPTGVLSSLSGLASKLVPAAGA